MKSKTSFMTFMILLSFLSVIFFSCVKETLTPTFTHAAANTEYHIGAVDAFTDEVVNSDNSLDLENEFLNDALAKVEFAAHPDWGVAIKPFNCRGVGKTLVVYNPKDKNFDFYRSGDFNIYWFKDGKPLPRERTHVLSCVCGGNYTAIVVHRATQAGIGISSQAVRSCPDINHQAAKTQAQ